MKFCKIILFVILSISINNVYSQDLITDGVEEYYVNGERWLRNEKDGQIIYVTLNTDQNYGKYYFLHIYLENNEFIHYDFIPENIFGICERITPEGSTKEEIINSISYENYAKKVKRSNTWALILLAMGEAMSNANAGYSTSTTYTPYGTYHTNTYNAYIAKQASLESSARINAYVNSFENEKNLIETHYLKRHTMYTGSNISGYTLLKYIKTNELSVYIPIYDKIFKFTFEADFLYTPKEKKRLERKQ